MESQNTPVGSDDAFHKKMMQRALALAQRAEGATSPNPMVGAVVVREGRILGEGYHQRAGQPHGEREALKAVRAAGENPQGADIYVTLEPCCHHGRTPPCTAALIEAGVKRVFYASSDPNPLVAGKGHALLQAAGIHVQSGILKREADQLNRAFFHFISRKRPYVTAKFAASLDGKIATGSGESQWITGPAARAEGHRLRHISDGILVGAGTVKSDDPMLTTRLPDKTGLNPVRIILDSRKGLSLDFKVFAPDAQAQTILVTTRKDNARRKLLTERGIQILELEPDSNGLIPLPDLLDHLGRLQVMRIMVEGGSRVLGQFLEQNLIQEVWAFIAMRLIGGNQAPGPFGAKGIALLNETPWLVPFEQRMLDRDLCIKARLQRH